MGDNYENRPTREAELVLTPTDQCFILDKTKGVVTTWVGSVKTSLSNTDSPVVFNTKTFGFDETTMQKAIQKIVVIPEGFYGQLKNPSSTFPKTGTANNTPELMAGQKINIIGPKSFALWPGQMVRVIRGHSLRSNQYLIVRIYDDTKITDRAALNIPAIKEDTELAVGKQFIIKGTEMSFFIPADGVEVVRDQDNNYVREALTLEQLEYCILLNEDGDKRYVQGPDVVFPTVTEKFVLNKQGTAIFRAMELTPTSGVYVKVTAPYTDDYGTSHVIGEELFITGKEQMIYFPRKEHTIIRYGQQPINFATAVPAGDARYLLNKNTGEVTTKAGPAMILPDPRDEVFINRVLTVKECQLLFPNNVTVLQHNTGLMDTMADGVSYSASASVIEELSMKSMATTRSRGVDFERGSTPHKPHSITIDNKFEGAVKFSVWTGYAVQLVKGNERCVVIGPAQVILDYDETIEILSLSSGKPKNTDNLIETAFLRYNNNKVGDIIHAQTADFVDVAIKVSFLVNFDPAESDKWFAVDNYVKLLCDRVRSKVKRTVKEMKIREFYADGYGIVRRRILGDAGSTGMYFEENGMTVVDVDILSISINSDVEQQLEEAANKAFRESLRLDDLKARAKAKEESLTYQQKITELATQLEEAKLAAKLAEIEAADTITAAERNREIEALEFRTMIEDNKVKVEAERDDFLRNAKILAADTEAQAQVARQKLINAAAAEAHQLETETDVEAKKLRLALEIDEDAQRILYQTQMTQLQKEKLAAQAEAQRTVLGAIDPHLTAELKRVADTTENFKIADTLAKNLAPTSLIAGKSMADILLELSKGTVYEEIFSGITAEVEL